MNCTPNRIETSSRASLITTRALPSIRWLAGRSGWVWMSWWIWVLLALPAHAELLVRVGIVVNVSRLTVGSSTDARILDAQGNAIAEVEGMQPLSATRVGQDVQVGSVSDDRLFLQPSQPDGLVFIGQNWYRGLVEVVPSDRGSGLVAVNQVGLEDYISSVVGSEMGHRFPIEALKAQAVAARTYALFHRNQRLQEPFDLGDTQEWQVYKGVISESSQTQAAARQTASQVLTYQGRVINAVFHSSSGGHTEDAGNVWIESLPYLRGVPDYDMAAPVFSWRTTFSPEQLRPLMSGLGTLLDVEVVQRTQWGRARMVRLTGSNGSRDVRAEEFRAALRLRSTMFTISPRGDGGSGPANSFAVNGRGFGHGVGMSQWGAAGLASQGWTYQQILAHYYQGSRLAAIQTQ